MFKLHDIIPAAPQTISESKEHPAAGKAEVVYIHPEGRYYVLKFTYPGGSFCESRFFSESEKEIGARQGLFKYRTNCNVTPMRTTVVPKGFAIPKVENNSHDISIFDDDLDAAMF